MAVTSIQRRSRGADDVFEAVDANLAAGVFVIPSTTATTDPSLQGIKVATDAAVNVLGVSQKSCVTAANQAAAAAGTDSQNFPFANTGIPTPQTAVFSNGVVPILFAAGAVNYGDRVCAAASGSARKWVSGTDAEEAVCGICVQPGDTAGGVVALVKLIKLA